MSWRETLGVTPSTETLYAHNPQNTQKPIESGNCADIADSAYRNPEEERSKFLETLADACRGLDITPVEVKEALAPEDIEDWHDGAISAETLASFAGSLIQRREMDQGRRPDHYNEQATCEHCGPVWLWFSGSVLGCPWCWNRVADKPIPRPSTVQCGECIHFERILSPFRHPQLGHCAKGEPEAIAGLWDTDPRGCSRWLPLLQIQE
ncbi:MAG: hypothetical protein H6963_03460 [Chromatiaceae bacterium]|nr:hypothetical protein [Chromatiaceae bacterium]